MLGRLLFLLLVGCCFAAPTTGAVALSGQSILYPIDAGQRGTAIISTFTSLSPAKGVQTPEVALQTTLPPGIPYTTYQYITNGVIPYIQGITSTTYNTLLIIGYLSQKQSSQWQYVVVPVEQVTALVYFPLQTNVPNSWLGSNPAPFNSGVVNGTLPYFWVNPKERAADIAAAVNSLLSPPITPVGQTQTQVWMQVTLTGPFRPQIPLAPGTPYGLLQNITSISASSGFIQVNFLPPYSQGTTLTILLTPEQVQQIIYIYNVNSP